MRMEKKHKIYCGLVGAALAAWVVDATCFQPGAADVPAAVAAVAPPAVEAKGLATPVAQGSDPAGEDTNQWLTARLRAWSARNPDAAEGVRDVFSAPASWVPQKAQQAVAPPKVDEKVAETFAREHHLTAVVLGASGGSALVDGRLLHVGQVLGGCRLKSVSRGCADWVAPDGREFRVFISPGDENPVK
jgi:hypothetical protein